MHTRHTAIVYLHLYIFLEFDFFIIHPSFDYSKATLQIWDSSSSNFYQVDVYKIRSKKILKISISFSILFVFK